MEVVCCERVYYERVNLRLSLTGVYYQHSTSQITIGSESKEKDIALTLLNHACRIQKMSKTNKNIFWVQKYLVSTATEKYLGSTATVATGLIECTNSWIYWMLRRCPWSGHGKTAGEVKLRVCPQTPLACHYPFQDSLVHITHDFYDYDLMTFLKNFCTLRRMGPTNVLQIGPRTC